MAGPAGIRTEDQLMYQLRQLVGQSRSGAQQLARSSGVSENTIRAMSREGAPFPQQSTLEAVVRACGQDTRPWMDAWHRANDARPRPERSAGGQKATQLQIEELTKVVGQLAEQVAELTARLDAMGEVDHQQAHGERAYHRFLANLPEARFTPTPWVLREAQSEEGYVYWLPEQPSYTARSVTSFVEDVSAMTEKRKFLTRLRAYLNTTDDLEQAEEMRLEAEIDPSRYDRPVDQAEVDRYVLEMRERVRSYFTELAEGPSREAASTTS